MRSATVAQAGLAMPVGLTTEYKFFCDKSRLVSQIASIAIRIEVLTRGGAAW
jgi:hypothetical protein